MPIPITSPNFVIPPSLKAEKRRNITRISERVETFLLCLQLLLFIRIILLLTGLWQESIASHFVNFTNWLVQPGNMIIPPVKIGWYILEPGSAILIIVSIAAFKLLSLILDAVRMNKKDSLNQNPLS